MIFIKKYKILQNELFFAPGSLSVSCEMGLKFIVPLLHSGHLELVIFLTRAPAQVPVSPFSETGRDLFCSNGRVLTVISLVSINITPRSALVALLLISFTLNKVLYNFFILHIYNFAVLEFKLSVLGIKH